jgi:phage-related protein
VSGEVRLRVVFFKTRAGNEPVREWLKSLSLADKRTIGEDIKTVQFGWPIGIPVVRKIEPGLWEVRSSLKSGIARVMFTVEGNLMVLIHGFIKKTQKIPLDDLKRARERLAMLRGEK